MKRHLRDHPSRLWFDVGVGIGHYVTLWPKSMPRIVHRDISRNHPAYHDGLVKLGDFGISICPIPA